MRLRELAASRRVDTVATLGAKLVPVGPVLSHGLRPLKALPSGHLRKTNLPTFGGSISDRRPKGALLRRRRTPRASSLRASGTVLELQPVAADLNDVAVMGQPVKQRGSRLGVAKHAWPFTSALLAPSLGEATHRIVSAVITSPVQLFEDPDQRYLPAGWLVQVRR